MLDKLFAGLRHHAPIVVGCVALLAVFLFLSCMPTPTTLVLGKPMTAVAFEAAIINMEKELEVQAAEAKVEVARVNAAIVAKDRLKTAGQTDFENQIAARENLVTGIYDAILPVASTAGTAIGLPPDTTQFLLGGLFTLITGTPFGVWASKRSFKNGQVKK